MWYYSSSCEGIVSLYNKTVGREKSSTSRKMFESSRPFCLQSGWSKVLEKVDLQ